MKSRKEYTRPTVKKVNLALTDSLLAGCKTGVSSASGEFDTCQSSGALCIVTP